MDKHEAPAGHAKRPGGGLAVLLALAVVLGGLAPSPAVIAQTDRLLISIRASLLNPGGDPMTGVKVTLDGLAGEGTHEGVVDAQGQLEIDRIRPGTYAVSMEYVGYEFNTKGATIEVLPDGTLDPTLVDVVRKPEKGKKGMWKEILIFLGIAVAGGAAVG